jgi:molybdopterin/thiamine biosynthesis adenylyltransferase
MFFEHVYQNQPHLYRPFLFKIVSDNEKEQLHDWLIMNKQIELFDNIEAQIRELIKLNNPAQKLSEEAYLENTKKYLNGHSIECIGTWCYYPWSKKLVHVLSEDDFITVRTNRNQLKITPLEQKYLQKKAIGVIGLSVGQSVALTLVMERIGGLIKLADFDELDLSNLNRLRTGLYNIGVKKTLIAAREIAEIDPYIKVEIFSDGITNQNMDEFFDNIDLLVEVCDGLEIKIKSRLKARELKIPVVMDTNDRGMIDIERFDLEPKREILHGLISEEQIAKLDKLNPQEKLALIMKIVSFENTSERLKLSMNEIGKTINTWPQLASSVMIGAGSCADTCRRILLNQGVKSGRYYMDTLLTIN